MATRNLPMCALCPRFLSHGCQGWEPTMPILPFVSPPPPGDSQRSVRAAAVRASRGVPFGGVVCGLIKGSSHDEDIVQWTKAALVQLLTDQPNVHLFLVGAG